MKAIVFLLISIPIFSGAQLRIEWKNDFEPGEGAATGIVLNEGNVILSLTHVTYLFSSGGTTLANFGSGSGAMEIQKVQNKLYLIGGTALRIGSLTGQILESYNLTDDDGYPNALQNGKILGNGLYTAHSYNYLLKYKLNGERVFTKKVAELSTPEFLKAGGGYIYLHCNVINPSHGTRLMQYDTLGNQKWSIPVGYLDAMVADKAGNCYITAANPESTVTKINPAGEVVWSKLLNGQWAQGMSVYGDSLLLCGNISLNAITDKNQSCAFSIISATSGDILHQQDVDLYEDINERERMKTIATDGKAIYIGGTHSDENPRCFLIKLSREGNTTGIGENKTSNNFSIYPNPGGSQFRISCGQSDVSTLNVTVRNISGQVVYKKQISCNDQKTFTLDLGKQAAGNYSVEIVSGKDKTVKKIVVE